MRAAGGRLAAFLIVIASTGCSGVGAGPMFVRSTIGVPPETGVLEGVPGAKSHIHTFRTTALTLTDREGLLCFGIAGGAALSNQMRAGNYTANGDGTVTVEVPINTAFLGSACTVTFAFSHPDSAGISGSIEDGTLDNLDSFYWLMDERIRFRTWDLTDKLSIGMNMGMLWEMWQVDGDYMSDGGSGNQFVTTWSVSAPMGPSATLVLSKWLALTGTARLDPLMALVMVGFDTGDKWLFADATARVDVPLGDKFLLWGEGSAEIVPVELGRRSAQGARAMIGLAYQFEKNWMHYVADWK